jgi:bacillithiol synthase
VTDTVFSPEQMLNELNNSPEKFSPNVILRPLFQQRVLPSLAYIGGGGEIAYWLQLKSLFEYFNVQFPMLLLRDSFMLIDGATNKKLQKLQMSVGDLFTDEHQLINNFVKQNSHGETDITAEKNALESVFSDLMKKALSIDASLDKAVLAEKQAVLNAIAKLEGKLLKAEKQKMEVQLNQIKTVVSKLFPGGGLQERHDNFIPFYLKYGDNLFEVLLNAANQPTDSFTSLTFEE